MHPDGEVSAQNLAVEATTLLILRLLFEPRRHQVVIVKPLSNALYTVP